MIGARLGWLVLALRAIYCKEMAEGIYDLW